MNSDFVVLLSIPLSLGSPELFFCSLLYFYGTGSAIMAVCRQWEF